MRSGDILTVIINESAKADARSGTNTSKENSISAQSNGGTGFFDFIPGFGFGAGNKVDYDGEGNTSRKGSLTARISARVIDVLDNGNLVIEGSKKVTINDEDEIIKISGIVRPADIAPGNTIFSHNIANADIVYSGKGVASTGQRPGPFARLFNWIF
jgi:flagellar L-ring protein precursor FlgH